MPWMNLVGWGVTGLALFMILSKLAPDPRSQLRFSLWVYAVNFALPLGFCVLNQYWIAVIAGPGYIAIAIIMFGRHQGESVVRTVDHFSTSGSATEVSSSHHD